MSLAYIRQRYALPWLRQGLRVQVDGRPGVLGRAHGPYLGVRFDDLPDHRLPCHPTWQLTYYGADGQVLADFTTSAERGVRADGSASSLSRI